MWERTAGMGFKTGANRTDRDGKDGENPTRYIINCDANGSYVQETDISKLRRWTLLSSRGFVTYPHHDASGLCTWTTLTSGSKAWCYLVPKRKPQTMKQASRVYIRIALDADHMDCASEVLLQEHSEAHVLFLTKNSLL